MLSSFHTIFQPRLLFLLLHFMLSALILCSMHLHALTPSTPCIFAIFLHVLQFAVALPEERNVAESSLEGINDINEFIYQSIFLLFILI